MKSIKFVAGLVAGAAMLGAVSAHAAAEAVPLNISITVYEQHSTTNESGVITYTTTVISVKSADLVAKAATLLGVTLPAGAVLGSSVINSSIDDIQGGDVVIMSSTGVILWDLDGFGNDTGYASISYGFNEDVTQSSTALYNPRVPQPTLGKSTSYTIKGRGYLYIYLYSYPTDELDNYIGYSGWFYDDVGAIQAVKGGSGSQLTTGSLAFSGGGEVESYGYDSNENYFDIPMPASVTVSGAASNVPWSIFSMIY